MSTLKTNNIQHVDRSEPSIIINTDGSVNIAGTVSYEDSTNVDSVGVVTARKQLHVGTGVSIAAGGLNVTAGISTLAGIHLDDALSHTGDTNTKIRFPSADTFTVETAGSERMRVDSSGRVLIATTAVGRSGADELTIGSASGDKGLTIRSGNDSEGNIYFSDGSSGGNEETRGIIRFEHTDDSMRFFTASGDNFSSERLRITSAGKIGIGTDNPDELLHIFSESSNSKIVLEADNNSANNGIFWVDEGNNTQSEFYYSHPDNKQFLKLNGNGFEIYSKQTSSTIAKIGHGTGYNEFLVPNGDVGIGTETPGSKLTVAATSAQAIVTLKRTNSNGGAGSYGAINFAALDGHSVANMYALGDGDDEGAHIIFKTTSAASSSDPYNTATIERLRITSAGNIGIGTDDPENDLHIMDGSATMKLTSTTSLNSTRLILESESDSYGGVHFGDPSDEDSGRIRYYHGGSYPNSMRFATNTTDEMMIHSGGPVSFNSGIELGSGLDATTANTLDDYEEGNISMSFANLDVPSHVTTDYATYTKIGRQVTIRVQVTVSSSINDASGFGFQLPFTPSGGSKRVVIPAISDRSGSDKEPFAMVNVNETIHIFAKRLEGYAFQTYNTFSGNYIVVTGTYESA